MFFIIYTVYIVREVLFTRKNKKQNNFLPKTFLLKPGKITSQTLITGSSLVLEKLGMVVHTFDSHTWEAVTGGSLRRWGQPCLCTSVVFSFLLLWWNTVTTATRWGKVYLAHTHQSRSSTGTQGRNWNRSQRTIGETQTVPESLLDRPPWLVPYSLLSLFLTPPRTTWAGNTHSELDPFT